MSGVTPEKKIKTVFDLNPWYFSKAYHEYVKFLHDLNDSVQGKKTTDSTVVDDAVIASVEMLNEIETAASEIPLDTEQDQRYGNKAFKLFYEYITTNSENLLKKLLPEEYHEHVDEIKYYLNESFGNSTRIDYGSGHELSFIVFLLCLHKIGFFDEKHFSATVLKVFNKYLKVCRKLQTKFHMEPAGSRGVHSLDDFQFAPFLFGSAQLIGVKGFVPESYLNRDAVQTHLHYSLMLEAIEFIYETKTGPFYEHSNQLWNISAVPHWKKMNEGMFKMYEGEVLKKFPVVQHILFGSLFSFDRREGTEHLEKMTVRDVEPSEQLRAVVTAAPWAKPPTSVAQFKIPPVAKTSGVHHCGVSESGSLKDLHAEKHPEEQCPPAMYDP